MPLSRIDDIAPLLDPTALPRVLGRDEALRLGFTRNAIEHRLETASWRRVLPRTYLTHDTLTYDDRVRAALTFAGRAALLSGAVALADQGLRCVSRPDTMLVLVPRSTTCRSTAWVRIRRTRRMPERALLPGPRRAPLARAVADLALERRRLDDVSALVAEAVRRELCTIEELALELRAGPPNHSAYLRQAIDEVGDGAWSAPEARAATLMRRAHLPQFEQNAGIDLPDGRYVIVDFLWRGLRAVLEIDSLEHHSLPADADATSDRHLVLEASGFSVVHRAPRYVITQPRAFVDGIGLWLAGRHATLEP
jgi:very-short-patch-repair endonuclease